MIPVVLRVLAALLVVAALSGPNRGSLHWMLLQIGGAFSFLAVADRPDLLQQRGSLTDHLTSRPRLQGRTAVLAALGSGLATAGILAWAIAVWS